MFRLGQQRQFRPAEAIDKQENRSKRPCRQGGFGAENNESLAVDDPPIPAYYTLDFLNF
jgi:hypothetical protein